jgi:hypothetical protein
MVIRNLSSGIGRTFETFQTVFGYERIKEYKGSGNVIP